MINLENQSCLPLSRYFVSPRSYSNYWTQKKNLSLRRQSKTGNRKTHPSTCFSDSSDFVKRNFAASIWSMGMRYNFRFSRTGKYLQQKFRGITAVNAIKQTKNDIIIKCFCARYLYREQCKVRSRNLL